MAFITQPHSENKTSLGMNKTATRSGHKLKPSITRLVYHGTSDELAKLSNYKTKKLPCACCGCKCQGKLGLSEAGRVKLKTLRQQAAERKETQNGK
mgnify:CR=1 FL=1